MEKEILIKHGVRKRLMSAFGVSYPTVRNALRYKSHTELAQRIRYVTKKRYGGIEVEKPARG